MAAAKARKTQPSVSENATDAPIEDKQNQQPEGDTVITTVLTPDDSAPLEAAAREKEAEAKAKADEKAKSEAVKKLGKPAIVIDEGSDAVRIVAGGKVIAEIGDVALEEPKARQMAIEDIKKIAKEKGIKL